MLVITKDFSKADFEKAKNMLAKEGITISFKNIKRNSKGEIIGLKIVAKSKNSQVSYSAKEDEAIKPITINYSDDSISIGKGEDIHVLKNNKTKVVTGYNYKFVEGDDEGHSGGENVFIIKSTDNDDDEEEDVKIFVDNNGKTYKIKSSTSTSFTIDSDGKTTGNTFTIKQGDKDDVNEIIINGKGSNVWSTDEDVIIERIGKNKKSFVFMTSDDGQEPLFVIDGKEATKKEIDELDPDKIESMNVLKGKSAKDKYGDKAENGVIEVITKK